MPDPCEPPCPSCDYGVLPPQCLADAGQAPGLDAGADLCANVCCDCDYGVPPPAECCQPTVPPDAGTDPCANVCCECEYGVPPPPECCGK
ncbi:MAG: hypothetical protein HY901_08905 [Deltaproteobacteria bacterium]|nr:hypothetical protein [Deltaproteobacteria bacterium]